MLNVAEDGRAVHFPKDPNKFEFDSEVSAAFPDIAVRAIPNFLAAHDNHAAMLEPWLNEPGASVLDIGASRGHFFKALAKHYGAPILVGDVSLNAIDNSPDMCKLLKKEHPEVAVRCMDITGPEFLRKADHRVYDVVCCHYVLQFIPAEQQHAVLMRIFKMVRKGGVLIFGHKAQHYGDIGNLAHERYIEWRIGNGYTREEIEAKTQALKGSMFPMNHSHLITLMKMNFREVMETFRFMMFSTVFAIK